MARRTEGHTTPLTGRKMKKKRKWKEESRNFFGFLNSDTRKCFFCPYLVNVEQAGLKFVMLFV